VPPPGGSEPFVAFDASLQKIDQALLNDVAELSTHAVAQIRDQAEAILQGLRERALNLAQATEQLESLKEKASAFNDMYTRVLQLWDATQGSPLESRVNNIMQQILNGPINILKLERDVLTLELGIEVRPGFNFDGIRRELEVFEEHSGDVSQWGAFFQNGSHRGAINSFLFKYAKSAINFAEARAILPKSTSQLEGKNIPLVHQIFFRFAVLTKENVAKNADRLYAKFDEFFVQATGSGVSPLAALLGSILRIFLLFPTEQ
jgi:hypothetical protein